MFIFRIFAHGFLRLFFCTRVLYGFTWIFAHGTWYLAGGINIPFGIWIPGDIPDSVMEEKSVLLREDVNSVVF